MLFRLLYQPEHAARCYLWAGKTEKLTELAAAVGDRLLPPLPVGVGPWWQQTTSLASIAAQRDLLDDDSAGRLLNALLDLVARGRAGELIEDPTHSLTLQATKTACVLAGRGTDDDARALLDLLTGDVARADNQYQHHDEQHVQACQAIIAHHDELIWPALVRIFDLAEAGTHHALKALNDWHVLDFLRQSSSGPNDRPKASNPRRCLALTETQRRLLRERLRAMAAFGRYEAGVAVSTLGETDQSVTERAAQARDRLLNRPEPDGRTVSFGTRMVPDAYLVRFLDKTDRLACLEKMLAVATDRRDAAHNRQDALTAAANLVLNQGDDVKAAVHARSRAFVDGNEDGSFLDDEVTNPHPLSDIRVNFGAVSLRAAGLRLAQCSAVTSDDQRWVRDRAAIMLGRDDQHLVSECAVTLSRLGKEAIGDLDATLLANHPLPVVRQLAAVVAVTAPARYALVLRALAADSDSTVRTLLAHRLHDAYTVATDMAADTDNPNESIEDRQRAADSIREVLEVLNKDVRHTVRRAAAGLNS